MSLRRFGAIVTFVCILPYCSAQVHSLPVAASSQPAGECNDVAKAWRVVAFTTRSGWAWDVKRLKFLTDTGVVQLGHDCRAIHSGSASDPNHGNTAGYEPQNAFKDDSSWWGGRKDSVQFYLGFDCVQPRKVRSVQLEQHGSHVADYVEVQMLSRNGWKTVRGTHLQKTGQIEDVWEGCQKKCVKIRCSPGFKLVGTDGRGCGGTCQKKEPTSPTCAKNLARCGDSAKSGQPAQCCDGSNCFKTFFGSFCVPGFRRRLESSAVLV